MLGTRLTLPIAIVTGVALELAIGLSSGRREAWDSDQYWTVGAPIALALAFAIGRYARGRAWMAAAAIVPAQMTVMMVRNSELDLLLWPLAMILGAAMGTPFLGAAFVGRLSAR